MKPLSKEQIAELSATLAVYGLVVKTAPKARGGRMADLRRWKPETPAGRACKSNMIWLASLPPITGVTSYQVRAKNGRWYGENDKGFSWAVEYRRRVDANPKSYKGWRECR